MNDFHKWVDTTFGVGGNGSCLPGPYLPFSIVRLSPNTLPPNAPGGYSPNRPIYRFSHTNVSGTGGGGRYGNIGLLPFTGPLTACVPAFDKQEEFGEVGYYRVRLIPTDILCELTSTHQVGVHRYTFPQSRDNRILIDCGCCVQDGSGRESHARSIGGYIQLHNECEVSGRADVKGGWGHSYPYSVYFFMTVDTPVTWYESAVGNMSFHKEHVDGPDSRMVLCFNDPVVTVRVGISYVSVANAREALEREAGKKAFDVVRTESKAVWDKALGLINVDASESKFVKLLYSALYRLQCMPSDLGIDHENPYWHSGVRHFTDYYCLWDSVRNANSLLSLFAPETERDLLNCLLDIADHTGWLPDAWIAGHSAQVQGGSSADILFCEASAKGIEGVDYKKALYYMKKNAETESPNPLLYGRYVAEYRDNGYLSTNVPSSVSRHIEYSYQDWCRGKLAEQLGDTLTATRAFKDASNLWNLWRDDKRCFAPRQDDGEFVNHFEPWPWTQHLYREDKWYYEGTPFEWALTNFYAMEKLVTKYGGEEGFEKHLDWILDNRIYFWKEIILHVPFLYHWVGKPNRSCVQARRYLLEKYSCGPMGLPDNEDMGSHSSFIIGVLLGVYPVMGQDYYLLTAPLLEHTEITLGARGNKLIIEAPNAGIDRPFISDVQLNGEQINRSWVHHTELAQGAHIKITLSSADESWALGTKPPSPAE